MSGINTWNLLCCSQRITWELQELDKNPDNPEFIETRAELVGKLKLIDELVEVTKREEFEEERKMLWNRYIDLKIKVMAFFKKLWERKI